MTDPSPDGYAVPQATQAELDAMKPAEVLAARAAGSLDRLIGIPPNVAASATAAHVADVYQQLTADDALNMTPAQIVAAKSAGRFDTLLGRPGRLTHPTNF